jgi:hypothetical protein
VRAATRAAVTACDVSVAIAGLPAWRVHLNTPGETCVRFRLPSVDDRDPWPLSRVVAELSACGARRADRPHAVGGGRGVPLIHRQAMEWRGCPLHLEAQHLSDIGFDEVALTLPSWDELSDRVDDEDALWQLIDVVAVASGASWGVIGDGETAVEDQPDVRRHAGVVVPESRATIAPAAGARYATLPQSGLVVLLR